MYCKEKWRTAGGKDPLLGRVDGFQIDPSAILCFCTFLWKRLHQRVQLQQTNSGFLAGVQRFQIPDTGLYFANVAAAHHQHTQTALTDTTANG